MLSVPSYSGENLEKVCENSQVGENLACIASAKTFDCVSGFH